MKCLRFTAVPLTRMSDRKIASGRGCAQEFMWIVHKGVSKLGGGGLKSFILLAKVPNEYSPHATMGLGKLTTYR